VHLQPGSEFAGFTIERLLGTGGMGRVYLARHPRLERQVAVKVLNDAFGAEPKVRERFRQEALLAAQLRHPNIVAVYDRSGPEDPVLWLAMNYVSGGDMSVLLDRETALSARRAVDLITGAARGLDHAHRHGVLHRDVKPANLLIDVVDGTEQALVTDFGIARTLQHTATMSGVLASLAYAAPERFRNQPADARSDVYSLGCTFYEMLTGQAPFPRSDQAAVLAAHLTEPAPKPSALRSDIPTEFDAVIATALAKDPQDRHPTCLAFAEHAAAAIDRLRQPAPEATPAATLTAAPPTGELSAVTRRAKPATVRPAGRHGTHDRENWRQATTKLAPPKAAPPSRAPLVVAAIVLAIVGVLAAVVLTAVHSRSVSAAQTAGADTTHPSLPHSTTPLSTPRTPTQTPARPTIPCPSESAVLGYVQSSNDGSLPARTTVAAKTCDGNYVGATLGSSVGYAFVVLELDDNGMASNIFGPGTECRNLPDWVQQASLRIKHLVCPSEY
jgi:serine/threonine-protein kinase